MKLVVATISVMTAFMALAMTPEAARSFQAFERRAEAGDPEALYRLSAILEKGYDSIPADTVRSLELLKRSARAGYGPAQNYLGYLYQTGTMLEADPDSARFYIRSAADNGDNMAAYNLAYLLLAEERPEAVSYLERAADAGLPQAQTRMADLLAEGEILPADTLKAVELYEKAIRQGFHDAELRLLNMMGPRWMKLDAATALDEALRYRALGAPTIAVELLLQIGPLEPQTARAYALLGHAYSRGEGAPYDHRKANEYFAMAAIMGNPSAQFILAETLEIFPDALRDLMPDLAASMTAASLRESAAKAGITSAEEASAALVEAMVP